jgi:hypothetical protein
MKKVVERRIISKRRESPFVYFIPDTSWRVLVGQDALV